jgi:hypothetical protein
MKNKIDYKKLETQLTNQAVEQFKKENGCITIFDYDEIKKQVKEEVDKLKKENKPDKKDICIKVAKTTIKIAADVAMTTVICSTVGGVYTTAGKFIANGKRVNVAYKFACNANGLKIVKGLGKCIGAQAVKKIVK